MRRMLCQRMSQALRFHLKPFTDHTPLIEDLEIFLQLAHAMIHLLMPLFTCTG